jgi:ketosteroid isomerase-like protein
MSEENVEIVRELWEAFQGEDERAMVRLIHPELEFLGTVGGLQEGDMAHGLAEIREVFEAEDLDAWEERRLEVEEYIDAGDDVVVLVHEFRRGRDSGIELEAKTAIVLAVSGGRVIRMQGYMDRGKALEAAGLSG